MDIRKTFDEAALAVRDAHIEMLQNLIEQLRAELAEVTRQRDGWKEIVDRLADQRDHLEQQRGELLKAAELAKEALEDTVVELMQQRAIDAIRAVIEAAEKDVDVAYGSAEIYLTELATVKQQRDELLGALNEINDWLVCGCITSVDDMAQSFQYMIELSSAAIAKVKTS